MRNVRQIRTIGQQRKPLQTPNQDTLACERPEGNDLCRRRATKNETVHPVLEDPAQGGRLRLTRSVSVEEILADSAGWA